MAQGLVVQGDLSRDLDHPGDLTVENHILPGRKISVRGNLAVGGDIQGSVVVVGGDITVKGTIASAQNGAVTATGRVSALRLENARLECGRPLVVEGSIVTSSVRSKATVETAGDIEGGEVLARHSVKARTIGTSQGLATRVGVGIEFKLIAVLEEMEREIAEVKEKTEKIRSALSALELKEKTYNKIPYNEKKLLSETRPSLDILERQLEGLLSRKGKLDKKLSKTLDAFVEVAGRVHPNTELSVRNRVVVTQRELPAGKYTLREGKIFRIG